MAIDQTIAGKTASLAFPFQMPYGFGFALCCFRLADGETHDWPAGAKIS